jgi:hypothetical protein
MTKYYGYVSFEFMAEDDTDAEQIADMAYNRIRNMAEIKTAHLGDLEADCNESSTG